MSSGGSWQRIHCLIMDNDDQYIICKVKLCGIVLRSDYYCEFAVFYFH